ncbi:DUF1816 domain-containing protein [Oscillatoria sp. FACHB-1406]|uniref:DUF1816 domain-containing protein n=1 Tax=Oscillatoria sp. FACHB-1406 TaxID=2692846 RepID=UPI0016874676|nr:DUF1816 domain-containing protein [Oscillatoria sp. FACHB-1406]MBD2577244.1 DUF1816 domain-containing protein [Oscillatoria sp. FACHB-1406]
MKEMLIKILEFFGLAWWVEIVTDSPRCTYYFGPFLEKSEADTASLGYIDDLKQEGASGISLRVSRMKPDELTIADDLGETFDRDRVPAFGGQLPRPSV